MKKTDLKTPEKKEHTTIEKIGNFITTTGFILEMEVCKFLEDNGYKVFVNRYFFDYDENKKREIDIVASKTLNEINIVFIIECKQNTANDWIFVCSDKKPSRYYNFIKFFPDMPYQQEIDKTKIFDHLRSVDQKLSLAQNSTIRHMSGKQSDSREIYECLTKLPKATIGLIEDIGVPKKRTIFIPTAIFSGQIFTVEYENKLNVKEVDEVQYAYELDSENYKYNYVHNDLSYLTIGSDNISKKENTPAAKISRDMGYNYLIEFVTKKVLNLFCLISKVEYQKLI